MRKVLIKLFSIIWGSWECPNCGDYVSYQYNTCPNCGYCNPDWDDAF